MPSIRIPPTFPALDFAQPSGDPMSTCRISMFYTKPAVKGKQGFEGLGRWRASQLHSTPRIHVECGGLPPLKTRGACSPSRQGDPEIALGQACLSGTSGSKPPHSTCLCRWGAINGPPSWRSFCSPHVDGRHHWTCSQKSPRCRTRSSNRGSGSGFPPRSMGARSSPLPGHAQ
jgi:hypothetical protein